MSIVIVVSMFDGNYPHYLYGHIVSLHISGVVVDLRLCSFHVSS